MDCTHCQEIASAALDGEATSAEITAARNHIRRCPACAAESQAVSALHDALRLVPADEVPDLSARILAEATPRRTSVPTAGHSPGIVLRVAIAAVAAVLVAVALPAVLGDNEGMPMHEARHIGSCAMALAVGFLWVSLRPRLALAGFLPVSTVLVVLIVASSIGSTSTSVGRELVLALGLLGLGLSWALALRHNHHPRVRGIIEA